MNEQKIYKYWSMDTWLIFFTNTDIVVFKTKLQYLLVHYYSDEFITRRAHRKTFRSITPKNKYLNIILFSSCL